jgi:hypothetical protein
VKLDPDRIVATGIVVLVVGLTMWSRLFGHQPLPERPVFHVFGSSVTVGFPGQKDQVYFRWCDPDTGYLMWANGFSEGSTITAVKDSHCDGAH